ncbi:MAG TPA: glycosyltransferase [Gemmatimonadales bacterium]|nr:glycosyltransferase [Gemmatimonadales bacterium]
MRVVMFYHSLISDWNHGNAHFLRGIVRELRARSHEVRVLEPRDGWSRLQLIRDQGPGALEALRVAQPDLTSTLYGPGVPDLDRLLDDADLVLVHEWNAPALVRAIGAHRRRAGGYRLFFHDTHHRSVSAPAEMAAYDLSQYDGVLAFGEVVRQRYLDESWADGVWTWHEAADARLFRPHPEISAEGDVVWIGNWGDDERSSELEEYLIGPIERLGLRSRVYGVRYPDEARARLASAGVEYAGWLPNHRVPDAFARFAATVHVPRRPYVKALPGVPTIRVFEALACGIPLVSAPWDDAEHLFTPGTDFLVARSGAGMREALTDLLQDRGAAGAMAARGLDTIRRRHTCAHRVDELMTILASLQTVPTSAASRRSA